MSPEATKIGMKKGLRLSKILCIRLEITPSGIGYPNYRP
jgi:hypothetical protein